jgi:pyruvate/2-oxoglutarate dehydrogenase complex dihydrolipoamide acyltransferase (E2) component
MTTPVVLPKWGMGLEEGTITQWLKAEGDAVTEGEPIVEIETAKATQAVEAPASGRLSKILVAVGETVAVSTQIGLIEPGDG